MERFCTNCGNPLEEGTLFCPECGQKVEIQPSVPETNFVAAAAAAAAAPAAAAADYNFGMPAQTVAEPAAKPAPEVAPQTYTAPQPEPAPHYTAPQPQPEPAPYYAAPQPAVPEVTPAAEPAGKEQVVKTGTYFWLMLLFAIPVIGFIIMIVMAFTAKKKSLKNWVRANLLWIIILFILSLILGLVAYILGKNAGIELTNIDYNALFQSLFDALGI